MRWWMAGGASHADRPWASANAAPQSVTADDAEARGSDGLALVAALARHGAAPVDEVAGGEFVDDRIRESE